MTVKELKLKMASLPDETLVLVPIKDHSYRSAAATTKTALFDKKSRTWTEDYGEEETPEADYGKRLKVLAIA